MNNIQESSYFLLKGNKLKNESINYDISLDINLLKDIKKFNEYKNTVLTQIKMKISFSFLVCYIRNILS